MKFELSGKLEVIFDIVQRSPTFKTREFVLKTSEEGGTRTFENFIKFQCVQDKTEILDKYKVGDQVKVYFNIRGTKWEKEGRVTYITNLDAWRIEGLLKNEGVDSEPAENTFSSPSAEDIDDLPF